MGMIRMVSTVQILIGAAIKLLSIVVALEIRKNASKYLRTRWLIITAFVFCFF